MQSFFPLEQNSIGSRFANRGTLLVFDFDGTLAPIVDKPEHAAIPSSTVKLLQELLYSFPAAVLSGRSLDDLQSLVGDLPFAYLLGNHGNESAGELITDAHLAMQAQVDRWTAFLTTQLCNVPGVLVENKKYTLAVHHRLAKQKAHARRKILRALNQLTGATVIHGHLVFDVMPQGAKKKSDALLALAQEIGVRRLLFIGDDETDEEAFRCRPVCPFLPIRIGYRRKSAAKYFLRSQQQVDQLLAYFVKEGEKNKFKTNSWLSLHG